MNSRRLNEDEVNLRDYAVIIVKRRKTILVFMATAWLISLSASPKAVPIFQAKASILVENVTPDVGIMIPGIKTSGVVSSSFMDTVAKTAKSQMVADAAVRILKSKTVAASKIQGDSAEWMDAESGAVMIQSNVFVDRVPGTSLVNIRANAYQPRLAMDIANTVAKITVAQSLQGLSGTGESTERFVDNQLEIFRKKLADSQAALTTYKAARNLGDAEDSITQLNTIETQLADTQLKRQIAESRLVALREQMAKEKKNVAPTIARNQTPLISKLREKLGELELQRSLLLRDYTEEHPEVQDIQNQIQETTEILQQETAHALSSQAGVDPWAIYQDQMKEVMNLEVEINSAKVREESLRKLYQEISNSESSQTGGNMELMKLTHEFNTNKKTYNMLLARKEQMRVDASLSGGKARIFKLADMPKAPLPRKMEVQIFLGIFLGFVIGVVMAFIQENMDTSIKTIEEVGKYLDLPVIGVIPKILTREEKEQRRSRVRLRKEPAAA